MAFCSEPFHLGASNELRGPSELGANPGRDDFADCFASPYQGAGVCLRARAGFDGQGLARKHGLIDQDRSIEQADVRGDDGAER
jgi:hypothetical protein